MSKQKDPFRDTLNLPKTEFAMRANLVEREPQLQKRWADIGLEARIAERKAPKGPFVFHDGPPYANGPIHLGHLLNKVLKDMVVRSRRMMGHEVRYIPGWDCHGLPIEHRVMKELGKEARSLTTIQIRERCQRYAENFVEIQAGQMKRLGTSASYDDPYITMAPRYEAGVLEVFAKLVAEGIVYRDLKPVHWSIANRTALADAELEYENRIDTSIFVRFELEDSSKLPASLNAPSGETVALTVWTTTPWTLPANLAVVTAPRGLYGLYRYEHGGKTQLSIVAEDLEEAVFDKAGIETRDCLGTCTGQELADAGLTYTHPFIERSGPVSFADYVTTEDGTGLVHTAPGHGVEDYQTGLRLGLDIYCPVLGNGTYDDSVPEWLQGMNVWKANDEVVERLGASGHLLHSEKFEHSYPHDWRSKTPTIFRATEQWFIAVDEPLKNHGGTLREKALACTEGGVEFVPAWGANRMRGMLDSRPDWCISRQRTWGLPIPAFVCEGKETLLTVASVGAVIEKIRAHGSNIWFEESAQELLSAYDPAIDPDAPAWLKDGDGKSQLDKGGDIFDVWFESGSSWNAVLREREIGFPAELYLEGSDQHRGWFQLSLLPALGAMGVPPFKTILTHGFMVDAAGRKMSKSLGNALAVDTILEQYGADIARWWASTLNYANDIKVDAAFFKNAADEYRKVRNTLRFLLGNLSDFDPKTDRVEFTDEDRHSIDAWAQQQLAVLIETCREGYETYQFKRVSEAIFNFCNDTLSAVYVSALKDRMYCDATTSRRRRRAQTVLFDTASAIAKLIAPILVHTADEMWITLHGETLEESKSSIHLELFPTPSAAGGDSTWERILEIRHEASKVLEERKASLELKNPLDAGLRVTLKSDEFARLAPYGAELADLTGVSRFAFVAGDAFAVEVDDLRGEPRCERSWKRDGTVSERSNGHFLSARDATALGV